MQKIGVKLHRDRDEILNFCRKFKKIHIYGNGICANLMCRYFEEEGIIIEDTIVSDGHKTTDIFNNKYKVFEISQKSFGDDDGIIVCVKGLFRDAIYDILIENNVPTEAIYIQNIYMKDYNCKVRETSIIGFDKSKEGTYFKEHKQLDSIGCKYNTDKSSNHHNYLDKYEFFVNKWKKEKVTVLELGVFKGSSTNMWAEYFENGIIYGVDINPNCKKHEKENVKILIKDLGDENSLEELKMLHPQIIIDDASHFWTHQIKALYHLLPSLESGGVFILEDLGTSFASYRETGYDDASITAYDFCQAIAEVVCSREFLRTARLDGNLMNLKEEIEFLASQIDMISFIHESCIIIKK